MIIGESMLNDRECRNAKRKEKPYKLADGGGLYLVFLNLDHKRPIAE
jgi:hypothetical protein